MHPRKTSLPQPGSAPVSAPCQGLSPFFLRTPPPLSCGWQRRRPRNQPALRGGAGAARADPNLSPWPVASTARARSSAHRPPSHDDAFGAFSTPARLFFRPTTPLAPTFTRKVRVRVGDPWSAARALVPLPASVPPVPSPADPHRFLVAAFAIVRGAAAAAAAGCSSPRCLPLPSSCCPWRPVPRPPRPGPLSSPVPLSPAPRPRDGDGGGTP